MEKIEIEVNGKAIELSGFPAKIIKNAIIGMLKALRGVDEIESAVIRLGKETK
jgi:hypothetical protein